MSKWLDRIVSAEWAKRFKQSEEFTKSEMARLGITEKELHEGGYSLAINEDGYAYELKKDKESK